MESLKLPQDIEACIYLTKLKEFENYIQNEYVIGINLVSDLFSKLFAMPRAKDIVDSIRMTTEASNILRTIKSKKLWHKFTEEMLQRRSGELDSRNHNKPMFRKSVLFKIGFTKVIQISHGRTKEYLERTKNKVQAPQTTL